jgi:hypothetical protein
MNFGSLAIKTLVLLLILFLLSLAGAITFPSLSAITGSTGAGLTTLLFLFVTTLVLSVIGYLLGRGIRTVKKPFEAFILTYVGSFFMGAGLALFAILNIPFTPRVNLAWLGTSWYSPILALLFIGTSIMLVFLVGE